MKKKKNQAQLICAYTTQTSIRACICADKRDYINEPHKVRRQLLEETMRKISGNCRQCNKPVWDSNGILLTTHEAQMRRWKEHFKQLLNQPEPVIRQVITPAQTELQI